MLESTGLKADCIFYTSLISACAKAGKVDLVFQVKGHLIDSSTPLLLSLVEDSEMGVKAWS
jgi:pentatricopeptide repeat protein